MKDADRFPTAASWEALRQIVHSTERELGLQFDGETSIPRGVRECVREFEIGIFMSRDMLNARERFVVWLSAACVTGSECRLVPLAKSALDGELSAKAISEIFLQCSLYAGFGAAERAFAATRLETDAEIEPDMAGAFGDASLEMRTLLHGERRDKGYSDPQAALLSELYELVAGYGYGVVWRRSGLSIRERLICAVASLACISSASDTLRKFAVTAQNHSVTNRELAEIVIQAAPFSGFPKAFSAMRSVTDALGGGKGAET